MHVITKAIKKRDNHRLRHIKIFDHSVTSLALADISLDRPNAPGVLSPAEPQRRKHIYLQREFPASSHMNTGSKMVYRDLKFKPGHSTNISVALVLLASIGPAGAFGFTFSNGGPGEYSYPADPQYQLEPRGRAHKPARKCPKGHALWQGKCRIALPVYPSR